MVAPGHLTTGDGPDSTSNDLGSAQGAGKVEVLVEVLEGILRCAMTHGTGKPAPVNGTYALIVSEARFSAAVAALDAAKRAISEDDEPNGGVCSGTCDDPLCRGCVAPPPAPFAALVVRA